MLLIACYPLIYNGQETFQGGILQFYINHVQVSAPWHDPLLHTMNFLNYDAMSLGNHDLEMPQEKLIWRMKESSFPWLGANIQQDPEDSNHSLRFDPYKVLERNGVRIGILGMTTPGVTHLAEFSQTERFFFSRHSFQFMKMGFGSEDRRKSGFADRSFSLRE